MNRSNESFAAWLKKNNPLYLLSVVLMLAGLYLVGSELETGHVSSLQVSGFFAVQNLYEIIMVAMALYLLKKKIQPGHGKLLLFFVLLFLGDLTFYQVRISGLSLAVGGVATGVYIILAIIKLAAVIKVLQLQVHHTRLFYAGGAFALIWLAPKVVYLLVDSIGRESFNYFDGSYVFYSIWLIAGLIHLPLIIENWRVNRLHEPVANEYFGNETDFWRWLLIFPFFVLPLQMGMNVMSDTYRFVEPTLPVSVVIAPWLLAAAFFAQTLWRHLFTAKNSLNICDSVIMMVFLLIVKVSSPDYSLPVIINHVLLLTGLAATWLTRNNMVNAAAIGVIGLWHTGNQLLVGARSAVAYGSTLTRTAWAAILMAGSFLLLGTGFLFSIAKGSSDNDNSEESPEKPLEEIRS